MHNTEIEVLKEARVISVVLNGERVYPIVLDMDTVDMLQTSFKFKQFDYGTCFIDAQLVRTKAPIDLTDYIVMGTFKDRSGKVFTDTVGKPVVTYATARNISSGMIKLPVPNQVLKKIGVVECEIMLFDNVGNRMTSPRFNFYIESSIFEHTSDIIKAPICGTAICGKVICNTDTPQKTEELFSEDEEIKTFLTENFISRFGGK